ncbi:MAG: SCO family protein [Chitinophagaceae bacterium]|jgi:protein SCO1/2|nr:SCO family protein [Chitinophagaceae bacterium]
MVRYYLYFLVILVSCKSPVKPLPILGNPTIVGEDTIYPTIKNFSLINQERQVVSNASLKDKIYVADFVFLSCPTICPKMAKQMRDAYIAFATDNRVAFISHTIDPENDSVPRLKAYANNFGVSAPKWQFLTGNQDSIMDLATSSYFATAYPDSTSPGGFTHSGGLLLVDKNKHIRGVYNGTKPEETVRLITDIKKLLKEQF